MTSAKTGGPSDLHYLILGGSSGIGLAYAEQMAAVRVRLTLVARQRQQLIAAAGKLRDKGALVDCLTQDLTDQKGRRDLFASLAKETFTGLFVGGPSPKAGGHDEAPTEAAIKQAFDICVRYPTDVMDFVTPRVALAVTLSSSAALPPKSL